MSGVLSSFHGDFSGKAEWTLILFACSVVFSWYSKKTPLGLIYFIFSASLCVCGILSSKILMYSLVNKVTVSLFSLYLVIGVALKEGVVQKILYWMFTFCRGRTVRFYLALAAFASFFPSRRIQKEILSFLKINNAKVDQTTHFLFPILFVLASSLTLMGSLTSLLTSHINCVIFQEIDWGFFTYGPIALTLFIVCFAFFFFIINMQKKQGVFAHFHTKHHVQGNLDIRELHVVQKMTSYLAVDQVRNANISSSRLRIRKNSFATSPWQKKIIMTIFCLMMLCFAAGIHIFTVAPVCLSLFILTRCIKISESVEALPWDVFLLIVASLLFSHAFIQTGVHEWVAFRLDFLENDLSLITFFLFATAVMSFVMPSAIVCSFMLPIAYALCKKNNPALWQLLNAAVTLGSFFLFPKKNVISFDNETSNQDQHVELLKIQLLWIVVIYTVFIFHAFLFHLID
jgi:di/tricarboxylate transporter